MTWEERMAAKAEGRALKRTADERATYKCQVCYDTGWWNHGPESPDVWGSYSDPCPNCDLGKAIARQNA